MSSATIEDMGAWGEVEWLTWLKTAVIGYLMLPAAEADEALLQPFVVNRDEALAVQIYSQLMMYAPSSVPLAGSAASHAASSWAPEDGINSLNFMIAFAGLCSAGDLDRMIAIVDGKLGSALDAWYIHRVYGAISDYVFDRLPPEKVVRFAAYVKARRGIETPWLLSCRAIVHGLALGGEKALPELIRNVLPEAPLSPETRGRLKFLQQMITEYRPIVWQDVDPAGAPPWVKGVLADLAVHAAEDQLSPRFLAKSAAEPSGADVGPDDLHRQKATIDRQRSRLGSSAIYQRYSRLRAVIFKRPERRDASRY